MHAELQTSGEQVEHAWGGVEETGEEGTEYGRNRPPNPAAETTGR